MHLSGQTSKLVIAISSSRVLVVNCPLVNIYVYPFLCVRARQLLVQTFRE